MICCIVFSGRNKMKKIFVFAATLFFFSLFQISLQAWIASKRLTWNPESSNHPVIAADSFGNIHVVWSNELSSEPPEIYYKRSTDRGSNWSVINRMTWNSGFSSSPSIAVDAGYGVHLVWEDDSPGIYEIFYKHSTDAGNTWSAPKRLTWNSEYSISAAVATGPGNSVHVVWCQFISGKDFEIFYKGSFDGGTNWSGINRLTWNTNNGGDSWGPSVIVDPLNRIHVVWYGRTVGTDDFEIFHKQSTDGGSSWSALHRLTWNSQNSLVPSITADSNSIVHVTWEDDSPGNREIFYKKSTNGGSTWSGISRLSWNSGWSSFSCIASYQNVDIYVVWSDDTFGNSEICYKRSMDGGNNWSGLTRLTWNADSSETPFIAPDSLNIIHLVWKEKTPGNYEVFYKNSTGSILGF